MPDGQNVGSYKGEVFGREVGGGGKKLNCQAGFLRGMGDVEISTCGLISVTIPTAHVDFYLTVEVAKFTFPTKPCAKMIQGANRSSYSSICLNRFLIAPEE